MANTTQNAALIASDLIVEIIPRWATRYRGTSAQLIAEGLIPDGFVWPTRTQRQHWKTDDSEFWLERCKVPGSKGPMGTWANGDYWVLNHAIKGHNDFHQHLIYEKQLELHAMMHGRPAGWEKEWALACKARRDTAYQGFMAHVMGNMAPRKRGRPAKAAATRMQELTQ